MSVLAALFAQPSQWQHGYPLAKETHLKSGTLYPILIRLADRGLVEAQWQDEPAPGRPRRHLYRLTAEGLSVATAALAEARISMAAKNDAARPSRRPQPAQTAAALRGAAQGVSPRAVPDTATVS
jgi:PadR family transcriptional regulator, regulatory protein PadR